jgi:hypothetical protein
MNLILRGIPLALAGESTGAADDCGQLRFKGQVL